jgi:hypothetical protein
MAIDKEKFACPTCDGYIPNNQQVGEYCGALSRRNGQEICSACGMKEAWEDFLASNGKGENK